MDTCTEECYRFYYAQHSITIRHAAWILNRYDPRIDNPSYSSRNIDSNYRAIKRKFGKDTNAKSLIDTKEFFLWARGQYSDFEAVLPVDLIVNTGSGEITFPSLSLSSFSLPEDPVELRKLAIEQKEQIQIQQERINQLEAENARLLIDSKKWNHRKKKQSENAQKSRKW